MLCKQCGNKFKTWVNIAGELHNLKNRKYCLECSPFKKHNTKVFNRIIKYNCKCGETNPNNFYGHKKHICSKCQNKYNIEKGRKNKLLAIKLLGGECIICGFNEYPGSLDIHHIDPTKKDINFKCKRGWSEQRLTKELQYCVLLCKNHHQAIHDGHIMCP